ncbi:PASTA domain-containing protein [Promicromonospora iranensis]|uniref:PASTA domain-containing protein n=1 Tax=Promicromonospora iranensis TaxID=1105144 RepID=UPI0023A947BA|nr:PASTA domain-containing protein [Promicromonospora iranensis]
MNNDEQFAANLRTQVSQVAPKIDVDVARVVPAARRRRAARVGGVTLAMGLALGGGAWVATTLEAPGTALPGGSMTIAASPSPSPSGPPVTSGAGDELTNEPSNPVEDATVPPEGWRDATYLHVVTRHDTTKQGEETNPALFGIERWYGDGVSFELTANGPALLNVPTYLNLGHDETNVSFTWAELAELPTEPAALEEALRTAYEPTGQGEEAVLYAASGLVSAAPSSPELRAAAWELLKTLPGVEVQQGARDTADRLGTAATFMLFDATWTYIYDEEQDVPLETEESMGKIHSVDTFVTTEFTPLPDEVTDSAIEVPDFTAMTVEDAGIACQQAHLTCVFEDTESDTVPAGTIISSDPEAGALVSWGATVTLQLSTGS